MRTLLAGDLAAVLRVPAFRLYSVSRIAAGVGQSMLQAIIAWQVYAISGSALDLGIVGLVRFAPALGLSLISVSSSTPMIGSGSCSPPNPSR